MAKKQKSKQTHDEVPSRSNNLHCEDCERAYDYHEKDYKGEYFLCKCPFFEFSRFLRHDYCEHFKNK